MVVTEQNARASLASRLAGRFAKACAVPFEGTDLPRAVVTGNPVRPEILAVDRARDRDRGPPRPGPAPGSHGDRRGQRIVGLHPGQPGRGRAGPAVGRPGRPGHPPRGGRPGLGPATAGAGPGRIRRSSRPGRAGVPPGALRGPHRPPVRRVGPLRGSGRRLDGGRADGGGPGQRPGAAAHRPPRRPDRQRRGPGAGGCGRAGARRRVRRRSPGRPSSPRLLADPATLGAMAAAAHTLAHPDAARRVAALAEEHARRG